MVAPLPSHVDCTCDLLCKIPYRIKRSVLYRVLMLRRSASPTETELRLEYSHMIKEAIEMAPAGDEPPKYFVPSISTNDQALP